VLPEVDASERLASRASRPRRLELVRPASRYSCPRGQGESRVASLAPGAAGAAQAHEGAPPFMQEGRELDGGNEGDRC